MSIFLDKSVAPDGEMVKNAVGRYADIWDNIANWVRENYAGVTEEWTYAGKNYGWSYRLKLKKRTILYFIPQDGYFQNAFVFGDKAVEIIMQGNFPEKVKRDLREARKYAEGRGVRMEIRDMGMAEAVKEMVRVKMIN